MKLFKKDYSALSDEELVVWMAKGKKLAFDHLYERYAAAMHYFFQQKLKKDKEKAEDFVHDLFAKLIQKPESFDSSRIFKTWLYSVANNMVKNEYKKMQVRSNTQNGLEEDFGITDDSRGSLEILHWQNFEEKLEGVIEELDIKHSEVFQLRHLQEMSIKEIAEVLVINEGTVKSRLFHAHKKVAERMREFDPKNRR
ncbi:RNA polymerase sigma-70 factor, ECF subfamily [Lishizhenia tianjinensis]|uniref:RNA polymerase sigma-70 factor, ECF subfamily n=1 Tax=Lishizhenia tianjinensis TaxID=477690 RepID=A0A1I6YVY6_9FLAO|nr:sigma-70 family RNA polymerase sigma factor [Lishizhenia tianjinensis]SFT54683.1 RNA polymerase sigma-70 factor, ECF subfamily [Lishizhenia tianjinensis]